MPASPNAGDAVKFLMDSKTEVRQRGAQELSNQVAKFFREIPPPESYSRTITEIEVLQNRLLHNASANPRKGGLAAIRAIIAVVPPHTDHSKDMTKRLCDITMPLLRDSDPVVRINAIEVLLQLVQRFKAQVFEVAFDQLFRAMLLSMSDVHVKVVTAARELSALVRQTVSDVPQGGPFEVESFVSFLATAFEATNTFVINWVLDWLRHVNSLPDAKLILHLSRYLKELFVLLEKPDCASAAAEALTEALDDVKHFASDPTMSEQIAMTEFMSIALDFCTVAHRETRRVALSWVQTLLQVGSTRMMGQAHRIASAVTDQLNSKNEQSILLLASAINHDLQNIVATIFAAPADAGEGSAEGSTENTAESEDKADSSSDMGPYGLDCDALISSLLQHLRSEEASHLAALRWIAFIHRICPAITKKHFDGIFGHVLDTFAIPSPTVLRESIDTLSAIAGMDNFGHFVLLLLTKLEQNASTLLTKASTIFKHLQLRYQGEEGSQCELLFLKIAQILPAQKDKRFASKLVITLSTMLLTSTEMLPLRDLLKRGLDDERARTTFLGLFTSWCYDATAVIALCLLTRAYGTARDLIVRVGNAEVPPHTLVQLDKLVQMLESPVFSYIRIALLAPRANASLIQALFGLQMLLPQSSEQYVRLHKRLKTVTAVVLLENAGGSEPATGPDVQNSSPTDDQLDEKSLLQQFAAAQEELKAHERKLIAPGSQAS